MPQIDYMEKATLLPKNTHPKQIKYPSEIAVLLFPDSNVAPNSFTSNKMKFREICSSIL